MNKQQLAQKRNYFKFTLSGMIRPIDTKCLTEYETTLYRELVDIRDELLEKFDNNSKFLGLNVPDKCWCGKPSKYDPIGYPDKLSYKVCRKHINYERRFL